MKLSHTVNPRATQRNEYPGLDGVEELDMGFRGRYTHISGRLSGESPAALGNWVDILESYNDGMTHVLMDDEGRIFPYAKLESFQETPGSRKYAMPYGYTLTYSCVFRHIL